MLEKFVQHLQNQFAFLEGKSLLLAVSGGVDSMVMLDLCQRSGNKIAVAHCNFMLRGSESDDDERFVTGFCKHRNIPCYSTTFDTKAFARDYKLSVQVAARELRYNWFSHLLETDAFDYVLTAHHADDNLETFLINFIRGTGIDGLAGIPEQNDRVIRPMLPFSRQEIEGYASSAELPWREDSSNRSDQYLRNKIRQTVAPMLKGLSPTFPASFQQTLDHLKQAKSMADDASVLVGKEVLIKTQDKIIIKISDLKRLPNYRAYLYHWLNGFGFTAWNDIYSLVDAQSGKVVFAPEYRLLKDREVLILEPLKLDRERVVTIAEEVNEITGPVHLALESAVEIDATDTNSIFVDKQKLEFPLSIRKWEKGDVFYPSGMDGKKKISKFFKDEKVSLSDKENQWLLCSGHQIVWVVGKRADRRFLADRSTTNILKITLLK